MRIHPGLKETDLSPMNTALRYQMSEIFEYSLDRLKFARSEGNHEPKPEIHDTQRSLRNYLSDLEIVGLEFDKEDKSSAPKTAYAMTAWIDELFITEPSAWQLTWTENVLEWSLYGERESGGKFWGEALSAYTEGKWETLEVFYTCHLMGFRGAFEPAPWRTVVSGIQDLETWCERIGLVLQRQRAS